VLGPTLVRDLERDLFSVPRAVSHLDPEEVDRY
jgi:hypothetical protein